MPRLKESNSKVHLAVKKNSGVKKPKTKQKVKSKERKERKEKIVKKVPKMVETDGQNTEGDSSSSNLANTKVKVPKTKKTPKKSAAKALPNSNLKTEKKRKIPDSNLTTEAEAAPETKKRKHTPIESDPILRAQGRFKQYPLPLGIPSDTEPKNFDLEGVSIGMSSLVQKKVEQVVCKPGM
eukprot:TRINITY_DN3551_c0_g1_i1.p2 TRINITY_DN3551_c0_g1~~TRINITY_DN3551_c0_g1_i1.p2  ORF type:complete len:181 (-),score=29.29 TRINITY_DN3551_c0_g1_i1:891-1433(-)